jgi:hypothetical protein
VSAVISENVRDLKAPAPRSRPSPGLYPGLSRSAYEAIDAINVSSLAHFARTAAHARQFMLHPPAPSDAMNFGTAFHMSLLEQQRFLREYVVPPKCDRRTKEGKLAWAQFEAEHPGMAQELDAGDFNTIQRMREAAWSHPTASQLLGGAGHNEVAVVFNITFERLGDDGEATVLCKSLIDRIGSLAGWTYVIDVKSTVDAGFFGFAREIKKYDYGAKAAFYLDGCNLVSPRPRKFAWIACEKTPPNEIAIYEADDSAIAAGRSKYMRWLRLYEEAVRLNAWPGYPREVQSMSSEETEWRS